MAVNYTPEKISAYETGLVQQRQAFDLPPDAFTTLENAYVFREKVIKKLGAKKNGRLRRAFTNLAFFETGTSVWNFNAFPIYGTISSIDISGAPTVEITTTWPHGLANSDTVYISDVVGTTELNGNSYTVSNVTTTTFEVTQAGPSAYTSGGKFIANVAWSQLESNAVMEPGSFEMTIAAETITDNGDGTLTGDGGGPVTAATGTINYITGAVALTHAHGAAVATTISYAYFPGLPVMGIRNRELTTIAVEDTVAFDTKYAYVYASGAWREFITGTQWRGSNSDFFTSTSFWVDGSNNILFWATNGTTGASGDPIRYSNGSTWTDYSRDIDGTNLLQQAVDIFPFRGRLMAIHTWEGTSLSSTTEYRQRIRWAQIGDPTATDAWDQTVPGKGGYIDIPTAESITGYAFIRDDLIITCDRSTWIVKHTGRSIQPFYVERRNTELGGISKHGLVQFDTSVMCMGDKRMTHITPQDVTPADEKIPDLVLTVEDSNSGYKRVASSRDIPSKTAYWIYNDAYKGAYQDTFPNKRLIYNYENDSWGIFLDSYTALGERWLIASLTWADIRDEWQELGQTWASLQDGQPVKIAGNQQGYMFDIDDPQAGLFGNDPSLQIYAITGNDTTSTQLTVYDHNLPNLAIVRVEGVLTGTSFANLNDTHFQAVYVDADTINLNTWDSDTQEWVPQTDSSAGTYIGGGELAVVDNLNVTTKKFNYDESGENIQIGFMDVLTTDTQAGQVSCFVYLDYNPTEPINRVADSFFNNVIPTTNNPEDVTGSRRSWHRFFCPARSNYVEFQFTLSDAQMVTDAAISAIEIHQQIIWKRKAGR